MSRIKTYKQRNDKTKYTDHYSTPEEIYSHFVGGGLL